MGCGTLRRTRSRDEFVKVGLFLAKTVYTFVCGGIAKRGKVFHVPTHRRVRVFRKVALDRALKLRSKRSTHLHLTRRYVV